VLIIDLFYYFKAKIRELLLLVNTSYLITDLIISKPLFIFDQAHKKAFVSEKFSHYLY